MKPSEIEVKRPLVELDHPDEIVEMKLSESAREIKGKQTNTNTNIMNERVTEVHIASHVQGCWYPTNLIQIIKHIINQPSRKMETPEFRFEMTESAAKANWKILEKYNLSLEDALRENKNSQLGPGSEFRSVSTLDLIFSNHPLWPRLSSQLKHGADFPLDELDLETRKRDLQEALDFGNHKGADNNPELFEKMMNEDVIHGFSLVIPRDKVINLEGAVISPMNIADQAGINERGEIIAKKRLTHNQSMTFGSETSLNSRTQKDELQDVMYGTCLLRIIHQIVEYRRRYPNNKILIQKIDFKSAYRRTHLHATTVIQTITQLISLGLCYISLRLTFGGAPNPNFWSEVSESATDLANAILQCNDWDPSATFSPLQHLVPEPNIEKRITKLAQALPMAVPINVSDNGQVDCYIDDLTTVAVDINNNRKRAEAATLLALHTMGRPTNKDDPITRVNLVSLSKLTAEAALEEEKILLGWKLNTRNLSISLPFDKFKAWTSNINSIITQNKTTFKELETLIGRLGHVTLILPYSKHFMSRLRSLMYRAKHKRTVNLPEEVKEDLTFHAKILFIAHKGISMNLLTYRKVDILYRSDACPAGLGGYSAKGRAWRFFIPLNLQLRATLNMLEHLASIIGPWIDILENNMPQYSCLLSMTDSTTTQGWLKKSNFQENDKESKQMTHAKLRISREHALRMLNNNCKDYSQWFPGEDNDLADSLSRDFHLTDDQLYSLYFNSIPSQTPSNLKISPLPKEISSFLYSILQTLPGDTQQREKHKHSSLALGVVGQNSNKNLTWHRTPSLTLSHKDKRLSYSQHLPNKSETENLTKLLETPWLARQSKPPWTTYQRPSETTTRKTPERTSTESLADFYKNSTRATKTWTRLKNTKKRSHSAL